MKNRMQTVLASLIVIAPLLAIFVTSASANQPVDDRFLATWARSDGPVSGGQVDRTWMWGPQANSPVIEEAYADAPDGKRLVQYFDKSRMEINDPDADSSDPWFVTNGLLALELITGIQQVGDNEFVQHAPAEIPVAGDLEDPHGPTYAAMNLARELGARQTGEVIVETMDNLGLIDTDQSLAAYEVTDAYYVPETSHNVASVFWEFMNSSGTILQDGEYRNGALFPDPFYATGFPITEAYWSTVLIDGTPTNVLIQAFERRVLTYAPENPEGWQVEAGNVGLHYFHWVYEVLEAGGEPLPPDQGVESRCLDGDEQAFLTLINDYRDANGLGPLANSAVLNVAAYGHSEDMGSRNYFAHVNPDGLNPFDRMEAEGYDYATYRAENIAAGYTSAQEVFDAWQNSPEHNETMLSPNVNAIGIGRVEAPGSAYGVYWTTKFGGYVDAAPVCS